MTRSDYIILGSVLSEKAYALGEKGAYVLKVAKTASKSDICAALKDIFNVEVEKINTLITRGKVRRKSRTKRSAPIYVKLANTKKAIIKLKAGQELPKTIINNTSSEA